MTSLVRQNFNSVISDRNSVLENAGIEASFFTGDFAMAKTKSGCMVYVACANHIDAHRIKPKLQEFFSNQPDLVNNFEPDLPPNSAA